MQARSYKKEIIVFLMAGTGVADIGLNFVFNLRDLGYDHWCAGTSSDDVSIVSSPRHNLTYQRPVDVVLQGRVCGR